MKTNTQLKHSTLVHFKRPTGKLRYHPVCHWRVFPYGDHWVAESMTGQQIFARSRWQLENTLETFNQIY